MLTIEKLHDIVTNLEDMVLELKLLAENCDTSVTPCSHCDRESWNSPEEYELARMAAAQADRVYKLRTRFLALAENRRIN